MSETLTFERIVAGGSRLMANGRGRDDTPAALPVTAPEKAKKLAKPTSLGAGIEIVENSSPLAGIPHILREESMREL